MPKNKEEKNTFRTIVDIFVILNLIAFVSLGAFTYYQNEKINNLDKGGLQNEILISSIVEDTDQIIGKTIELLVKVESNFEGRIPIYIELLEVTKEDKRITSNYEHLWISKKESYLQANGEYLFKSNLTMQNQGLYKFLFVIYYNYDTEKGIEYGSKKSYEFDINFLK